MCIHNFDIERIDWDIKDLFGHIRTKPQENKSSYVLDWKNAISILLNNSALLLASSFFCEKGNDLLCRDNDLLLCHCIYVIKFEKVLVHLCYPIFI